MQGKSLQLLLAFAAHLKPLFKKNEQVFLNWDRFCPPHSTPRRREERTETFSVVITVQEGT